MADDIGFRLKNHSKRPPGCDCVRCEAADEIERLRDKVQDLRMHAEQDECEIERLRAENARLASFLHPIGQEARRG